MSWEAVSAVATAFTGLVVSVTVLVGWHQMRAAVEQNRQARRAAQLDGMIRIFEQFDSPAFQASESYIIGQLAEDMKRPDFDLSSKERPWQPALTTLERMGVYVKMGLLDAGPFYYHAGFRIIRMTRALQPLIERQRIAGDNPYFWKDTEALGIGVNAWAEEFVRREPRRRPVSGDIFKPSHFESNKAPVAANKPAQ